MIKKYFIFLFLNNLIYFLNAYYADEAIMMNNNQTDYSNLSVTTPENDKQYHIVEICILPFIFLIGTVCNILTFLVMRRKKMRHQSTYFYMAVLAVADEMVLLVGCLNYWIYLVFDKTITIMSNISCKLACVLLYGTFHFGVWIVVIMTVERFIAVALPLQASRLCTVKRAKISTLIIAFVIFAINFHFLVTHALISRNSGALGCQAIDEKYDFFMLHIWPWIDASTYSYIPLSLLIIFNILIVHNLIKASKNIQKLNSNSNKNRSNLKSQFFLFSLCPCLRFNSQKEHKKLFRFNLNQKKPSSKNLLVTSSHLSAVTSVVYNQENKVNTMNRSSSSANLTNSPTSQANQPSSANRRLTIMLLVVSMTFFITSTPIVILQTVEQAGVVSNSKALIVIRGIFLILQYMNHSINFFLYAVTGKTFRREFFALFKPFKKKMENNKALKYVNTSSQNNNNNNNYNSTGARRLNRVLLNEEAKKLIVKNELNNDQMKVSLSNKPNIKIKINDKSNPSSVVSKEEGGGGDAGLNDNSINNDSNLDLAKSMDFLMDNDNFKMSIITEV